MRFPFLKKQPAVPPRWMIVGLGNPGAEYKGTRHNVGFEVMDLLSSQHRIQLKGPEKRALVGYGSIKDEAVVLVKPITYMNLSGESIAPLMSMFELQPRDVLVIVDEMDLPVGRLRLRKEGSAGGHNGLKSLIQHLRTEEFPRIRIGVGRPPREGGNVDHVLGKFGRDELEPIRESIDRAADAVEVIMTDGFDAAMNRFNVK